MKEKFLEEVNILERKIQELRSLAERNGVSLRDLVKRAENDSNNFYKKMEEVAKMASKK